MTWWAVSINCPKCNGETTLQLANYSSDGELWYVFSCNACKELLHWKVFATSLARKALMSDMEKHEKAQQNLTPGKPVKPPLALPRVPEKLTVDDFKWLKAMEIEPPENGLLT